MRNIKLTIAYDGTNYCGWQIQNQDQKSKTKNFVSPACRQKLSIQGVLEKGLKQILREKVRVIGSGRTDAGVHALAQVANFKTTSRLQAEEISRALNASLPRDIRITEAGEVDSKFHSQFSAKSKIYRYLILNSQNSNPFLFKFTHQTAFSLNISLMAREARSLEGEHDFKSFSASGTNVKSTVRRIKNISLVAQRRFLPLGLGNKAGLIIVTIEADGFLYNMVRNIVGTLIDVGRGYFNEGDMRSILKAKNRQLAGRTAPAKGLYLCEVRYKRLIH